MKKFRKAMGLVLASAMLVASLAACGGDDKVKDQNAGSGSSNGEAVLKIGGIGPLTGGNAVYGQAAMNGAQIAIDEINEAGGINGMMIEFNAQDDEADPDKGVNAYNNLKDWGMQILMGCVTSGSCTAVSDYAHEDNLFLLTPSASSLTSITYDNAFRVCFSDPNQGVPRTIFPSISSRQRSRSFMITQMCILQVLPRSLRQRQIISALRSLQAKRSTPIIRRTFPYSFRRQRMQELSSYSFRSITMKLP